jgi:hypothetical protein
MASVWERYKGQRLAGQRELIRIVTAGHGVREGWTLEGAADVLFAIGSPEVYRLLVTDRGWSADRFETWFAEAMVRTLLA